MKDFHNVGTIAVAFFGLTGAVIAWFCFFAQIDDPHVHRVAGLALRVWIVVAAIFWGWYAREEKKRAFAGHLELRVTFDDANAASTWLAPGKTPSAVITIGNQGFGARLRRIDESAATAAAEIRLVVELLTPQAALAPLHPGAKPRVMIDGGPTGAGEVLRLLASARS